MRTRKPKTLPPAELSRAAVQPGGGLNRGGAAESARGPVGAAAAEGSPPDAVPQDERRGAIDSLAAALGKSWARHSREELHREGRAAAGGWPGTVGEATAHVAQAMLSAEHRLPAPTLTTAERSLLAREVYASARKEWLRHLDPEPPDQSEELHRRRSARDSRSV